MTDLPRAEIALAGYVALRMDDWQPSHGCPAWIESKDRQCGKEPVAGTALCRRHRGVASKRHDKHVETELTRQAARIEYRAEMLPVWEAELAKVEAEIERRDLPINDRAAVGGVSHPSIQRMQMRYLSDSNVKRMAYLTNRAAELRDKIGGDR